MNREEAIKWFEALLDYLAVDEFNEDARAAAKLAIEALLGPQPDPITGLVPCGCKYCDPTHGQRYLFRENKNAPYRGMISTVEITEDDCKKYSQIEGNLYDENGNNFYFVFDIRHCPMCGRELQVTL